MRPTGLSCQVCLLDCPSISSFKKHLRNGIHQQKKAELFQKEGSKGPGYLFPGYLTTIDILVKRPKHPLLGLSLVTLCLNSEDGSLFYLCHSCEGSVSDICKHFNCPEHRRNYFLYTNPNVLRFSWISSPKIYTILDPVALGKINKNWEQHTGQLQVLDLPPDVFETVKGSSYVKVMHTLSQNDNLLKQITAARPKRMTIQTYLGTPNGHSLLGLEHLVECSCEDQTDRRLYLCTVCKLTLTTDAKIINHLLGFHHIRCYINAWHPSTLMTYSCYGYDNVFHDTMRDFAKQMEEIHGTTISDMKQVVLRPDMFSSLEGRSYIDALAMLEHWRKLRKESSLITNITPGEKLVQKKGCKLKTVSASHDPAVSMKDSDAAAEKQEAEKKQPSDTETVDVPDQAKAGSTSHHDPVSMEERVVSTENEETAHRSDTETSETKKRWTDDVAAYDCWRCRQNGHWAQYCPNSAGKVPRDTCFECGQQGHRFRFCPIVTHRANQHPVTFSVLRCQVCTFETTALKQYFAHVRGGEHQQNMKTIFATEVTEDDPNGQVFHSSATFYKCHREITNTKRAQPVIGLLHIVTCVSTRAPCNMDPFSMCLVCRSVVVNTFRMLLHHVTHPGHIKHTLMHQNPARLPFAWKLNECDWDSLAWEEEQAQGPEHMVLKIIDLPIRVFSLFSDDYQHACRILNDHVSFDWTYEVPKMVTLDKLPSRLTYPQLGVQFLVRHKSDFGPWRSLCLLCEKTLDECKLSSHVYSFEHVRNFLDKAHPGSLDSEAKKNPDVLLDLAKQAAEIHPTGHIQEVTLNVPILHSTYRSAVLALQRKKEFMGEGILIPVLPVGEKLVPTEALKEIDHVFGSDTSPEMTKKLEGDANKERPDVKDPTPQPPDVKDPTPQPPDVKDPTPQPPDVKDPTPQHPDVKDPTPQPIPVEKEAVPEKDSCVHKPDEKKRPTQNTSVERRADSGTSVDRDTLKQSTEEQRTEKDQAAGRTFKWKFQWLRVISECQKTTCKREDDAGEESGTERGVTCQNATSVVGGETETECRPIPVEKEAASEKEPRVHKPDEKKCPTQNTSVERRVDTGTSVDRDTLKQRREEQRTEKRKETLKGDVGEEARTRRGVTSKDAKPRVRKGGKAEMESTTSEKRRRSEHARPEVAGKRRRLCDVEEREEKTQNSSREEGGQTAEVLSDVAADTKSPDQCVDHEGKHPVIFCLLSCQVCRLKFVTLLQYFAHVDGWEHNYKQRMKTIFKTEGTTVVYPEVENGPVVRSSILMSEYLSRGERSEPVIGLLHIVMCVTTRAYCKPLCVCTLCQRTFPACNLRNHLVHPLHIKLTLMHQNPARLPFAWRGSECERLLESLAWEEEKAQGPEHMVLKIIDLPCWVFMLFTKDYSQVCKLLDEHFCCDWLLEVPKLVTVDDLLGSHKSPQLGLQFLVPYQTDGCEGPGSSRSLCLLCERTLDKVELSCHVFSFEHVKAFLHNAHPGSLDCEVNKTPDKLLDLAKQAEKIHPTGCIQRVTLSSPINPDTYKNAVMVLQRKKKMDGQGQLIPVLPVGQKLVVSCCSDPEDFGSDNLKMTERPEGDADKGRPDVKDPTPHPPDVKDPTPQPPDVKDPTPQPPDVKDPTPQPPDVKDPTPQPPDVKGPTPQPPDVKDLASQHPQPVPVEKQAVSEKDSRVHKPDEKKRPTQNTSVERRADAGTIVDRDTLKQRREEQRTVKGKETQKVDVGEEAGTRRGATSKDASPRVRKGGEAETESTTSEKRRRSEHARPEVAGKRRRLCDAEERKQKTQKSSREEGGQTAEVLSDVAAETKSPDQCVDHEGRYGCDDFLLPPDIPQLDSDIDNMMELLDPSMLIAAASEEEQPQMDQRAMLKQSVIKLHRIDSPAVSEVTHNIQVSPTHPQGLQTPPSTSDCQPRPSPLISDVQDKDLQQPRVEPPTDECHLQVTPEDIMDLQVTPEDIMDLQVTPEDIMDLQVTPEDIMDFVTNTALRRCLKGIAKSQPVIGMSMIRKQTRKHYHCQCCSKDFRRSDLMDHIISNKHRYNYIRKAHPHMTPSPNQCQGRELHVLAQQVERDEESGRLKPFSAALQQPQPGDAEEMSACEKIQKTCEEEGDGAGDMSSICPTSETNTQDHRVTHRDSPAVSEVTHNIQVSPTHSQGHQTPPSTSDCPLTSDVQDKDLQQPQVEPPTDRCHLQVTTEDIVDPAIKNTALWKYCKGTKGTEPLIGLSMMKNVSAKHSTSIHFHCPCCSSDFPRSGLFSHVTSAEHRYKFIKKVHPHLIHDWPICVSLDEQDWARKLRDLAQQLVKDEVLDDVHGVPQPADALAVSEVTHNIQVSPTHPQGLQTPPSTSDCQPRPSPLISDVQDKDLQQPQVETPTDSCHLQVTAHQSLKAHAKSPLKADGASTTNKMNDDLKRILISKTVAELTELSKSCLTEDAAGTVSKGNSVVAATSHTDGETTTTSDALATDSKLAVGSETTAPTSESTAAELHLNQTSSSETPTSGVSSAEARGMAAAHPSHTQLTPLTPTVSRTTANPKPTARVSSATRDESESTATISKCTPSTTTSEPSTPVCHSATVVSKPTAATFSNTTPDVSKPSSSTTASQPSTNAGLSEALWESLWQDFEAAVEASSASGNGTNERPDRLATGSEPSPLHTLPPADARPDGPQSRDVQPESSRDYRTQPMDRQEARTHPVAPPDTMTQPVAPQDSRTQPVGLQYSSSTQPVGLQYSSTQPVGLQYSSTQPVALQYSSTQPVGLQYSSTQPVAAQDSIKQEGIPEDSKEWQQAPQNPGSRQEAPLCFATRPWPPQCSAGTHDITSSLSLAGITIDSRLSCYLRAMSEADRNRVVGLSSVLEYQCGEMSKNETLFPFYMCRSCQETVQLKRICEHITSIPHQLNYMWKEFPHIMTPIRDMENWSEKLKEEGYGYAIYKIAEREKFTQMDAEVIPLDKSSYHRVRVAPFSEGIHILEDILGHSSVTSSCPPADQQPPEATDSKENVRLTRSLPERTPFGAAVVKTEPTPEQMSDRTHPERLATLNAHNSTITVTIKQKVKQEDHAHSCFSGHAEMREAVKHGLDYVSLIEDGETVKRRRIEGPSGPYSNVSSPAGLRPSPPLNQEVRVKTETTSIPTTLDSLVTRRKPSQMQREKVLELNLECPPTTNPASTQSSTTPRFVDSSLLRHEPQPECPTLQDQEARVKVEPGQCPSPQNRVEAETSAHTALVSQAPRCEPSQTRPRPKLEQILNSLTILASSNFMLESPPTNPVSAASTEPSTTPWFIDSSLVDLEPQPELNSALSEVKQASPLPMLTPVTPFSLSPPANKDLPPSEPITSIVDVNDISRFISSVRAEQSGKDVPPGRASPENAIEIVTKTSTSTQTSVGCVKPRMQMDSKCRIAIAKPNQSVNVLKRKLAKPKPAADDDIWDYENRQFTPESCRGGDVIGDDRSLESCYRAADPAGEDGPVTSNHPAARAVCSTELQPWGDQTVQFNYNLDTTSATVRNPNNTAQVTQASACPPPFNIRGGPYMGGPVTAVNPDPTNQQFNGYDHRINQPTVSTVNTSDSLPAAGYGPPSVYPYNQVTQNFYFPHGYPYGPGPAGDSRAPEQHPAVFSQFVDYSDGSAGGSYPVHTPEQAWLDLQRQQQQPPQ